MDRTHSCRTYSMIINGALGTKDVRDAKLHLDIIEPLMWKSLSNRHFVSETCLFPTHMPRAISDILNLDRLKQKVVEGGFSPFPQETEKSTSLL